MKLFGHKFGDRRSELKVCVLVSQQSHNTPTYAFCPQSDAEEGGKKFHGATAVLDLDTGGFVFGELLPLRDFWKAD